LEKRCGNFIDLGLVLERSNLKGKEMKAETPRNPEIYPPSKPEVKPRPGEPERLQPDEEPQPFEPKREFQPEEPEPQRRERETEPAFS
jgi:hypothetical protein